MDAGRVVVFDLGNVVIPWDRRGALARFVDDPVELDRLCDEVFTLEVNVVLDRGAPLEEVRAAVEEVHPGHGWVVDGYVEHFRHSLGETIEGTAALIEELHDAGVRSVGLSNWSAVCFEGIPEAFPVLQRLDGILISGDVGVCKPDEAIFRLCEQRFGFDAAQAVFLDDSELNVAGARRAGWDAELFTDPRSARRDLAARGLLRA